MPFAPISLDDVGALHRVMLELTVPNPWEEPNEFQVEGLQRCFRARRLSLCNSTGGGFGHRGEHLLGGKFSVPVRGTGPLLDSLGSVGAQFSGLRIETLIVVTHNS